MVENLTGISREGLETSGGFSAARFSTMRVIFDPDLGYEQLLGSHWPDVARQQVRFFRRIGLKHRATPYLTEALQELNHLPSFRKVWSDAAYETPAPDSSMIRYEHQHQQSGPLLRYIGIAAEQRTPWGALYLATFIPQDAGTHTLFTHLYRQAPATSRRYADWPKPPSK